MKSVRCLRQCLLVLCVVLLTSGVYAQVQYGDKEYQPSVGQVGKDVIWVPTPQALADKMLDLAKVTMQDYVVDLGSGDGRIVITAAKRGARALGIEYNPDMVALSRRIAAREGVGDKAIFVHGDIFESNFSEATVVTMFLLPDLNLRLRPTILNLKPGTRIASNSFHMGDWQAEQTVTVTKEEGCDSSYCQAYFWVVPAKVEGKWQLPQGELTLKQSYQMISGTLKTGADTKVITDGKLYGAEISFSFGNEKYSGLVSGNSMAGVVKVGANTAEWKARRK